MKKEIVLQTLRIILAGLPFPNLQINNYSYIITYINKCLSHLYFSLCKDIFNHKNINCFSFFNNGNIFFMLNVYLNNYQSALKYLKNTKANLQNILIIASNFNIKDNIWNSLYPFYLIHSDFLFDIADSLGLKLFIPI